MGKLFVTLVEFIDDVSVRLRKDDEGSTAVEYGLMVALIALAIIVTVTALGGALNGLFGRVLAGITGP